MEPSEVAVQVSVREAELLQLLATPGADTRLRYAVGLLVNRTAEKGITGFTPHLYMVAVSALVTRGLAYTDYLSGDRNGASPANWYLRLTPSGALAAVDEDFSPDTPDRYLQLLRRRVPAVSDIGMVYLQEATHSFAARSYLASAVMVGVASEAAFYEVAESFQNWLPEPERSRFGKVLESNDSYNPKFNRWRDILQPRVKELPGDLGENLAVLIDGVLNQIRLYRNESGHPSGLSLNRDDAYTNLRLVPRYLERLYGLKEHFDHHSAQ